ncbi:hypothetical protein LAUMK13_03360 [Mycobacterium innocens]|uniref:Uncharacterized protein n=2 Tax=Mycobacterium innocens TaxID=2341083 RepID=A0A498Q856_9MYCO|nr:hypothetical protein LAUMK13_03360 [Mycobacterium innocens]
MTNVHRYAVSRQNLSHTTHETACPGSRDNNNGQAFPCIPNGGAVFGCQPCSAPDRSLLYTGNFLHALLPFLAHGLLSNLKVPVQNPAFDAVDQ